MVSNFSGGGLQFWGVSQFFGGVSPIFRGVSNFSGGSPIFRGGGLQPECSQSSAGTHPTGMHSCYSNLSKYLYLIRLDFDLKSCFCRLDGALVSVSQF